MTEHCKHCGRELGEVQGESFIDEGFCSADCLREWSEGAGFA